MKIIYLFIITFAGLVFSQSISKENLVKHIYTLGSDEFEGRGTGQPGGEKAAQYLAEEFQKLNLIPAGEDSSYFQNIRMHSGKPLDSSELELHTEDKKIKFNLWKDYLLYFSGEQTFIP